MDCYMIDYRIGKEWYRKKGGLGTIMYRDLKTARLKIEYYKERFDEAHIVKETTTIINDPLDDNIALVVRTYCRVE